MKIIILLSALLMPLYLTAQNVVFQEDFESCPVDRPVAGQNGWQERAFGKHPFGNVIKSADAVNATKVIQPAGSGDHHLYRNFSLAETKALAEANVILVRVAFHGGVTVFLGKFGKYGNSELDVQMGSGLSLNVAGKQTGGINESQSKTWQEGVFALVRQPDGTYRVFVATCPIDKTPAEFSADPVIGDVVIPANALNSGKWTALGFRLDNTDRLDNINISTFKNVEFLPFKFKLEAAGAVTFTPVLDHLIAPRQAVDLDGLWEASSSPDGGWQKVVVPALHNRLFNNKDNIVWFRRDLVLDRKDPSRRYELCFERVTDSCEVLVNGKSIGGSDDGHFPFRLDATEALRNGNNQLVVKVLGTKATGGGKVRPSGWEWFLPQFSGIPYPVHLESSAKIAVDDVFVLPHLNPASALETRVTVVNRSAKPEKITVEAAVAGAFNHRPLTVELQPGEKKELVLRDSWKNPELWWPHNPRLYNLDITLKSGSTVIDAFRQRFGFRELRVNGPEMTLNDVRFMHRRSSIIPYWRLTTEDEQRKMITLLRERGFNGYRMHGDSSPRIARIADELGWLVSPESAVNSPRGHEVAAAYWPNAEKHIMSMVKTLRNHPSVIYWCLSNEFACYYMKGTVAEKAVVDNRMVSYGKQVEKIDPSRIWTCSGDGELGGVGNHGPAPALSFHYAWQPCKPGNMIPNTADWLERGLRPWQGIVWDKTKPIMLSEDLYPPYALQFPHGMTQWGGDLPYDPQDGIYRSWFAAVRMLSSGYYNAGVSVWNIWGTAESAPDNPLYRHGQPVPDFLIHFKELNCSAICGTTLQRNIRVSNQTFMDRKCHLRGRLMDGSAEVSRFDRELTLPAGTTQSLPVDLAIPSGARRLLKLEMELSDNNNDVLTRESLTLSACPVIKVQAPAGCALVSASGLLPDAVLFPGGRYASLETALKSKPAALVLAAVKLSPAEAAMLRRAVNDGLNVLWLEMPLSGSAPVRLDNVNSAAFAFIRAAQDPAIKGLSPEELRLWLPELLVTRNSPVKPEEGEYDIILDCGSSKGLFHSPLLRVYNGSGYYLLCQLPVISSFKHEPVVPHLLQSMLSSLAAPLSRRNIPSATVAVNGTALTADINKQGIPTVSTGISPLLLVDGRKKISAEVLKQMREQCARGGSVLVNGMTAENLPELSQLTGAGITMKPSAASQLIRTGDLPLTAGLSNDDLFWRSGDDFNKEISATISGRPYVPNNVSMLDGELEIRSEKVILPFRPAGLAVIPVGNGRLVLSAIRWEQAAVTFPAKARRVIATLVKNLGCRSGNSSLTLRQWMPVDLAKAANCGFWQQSSQPVPGWFGDANDDLRYFPVNATGIDPELKVPQPPEKFPTEPVNYAGVDFKLLTPELNHGRSCLIIAPETESSIAIGGKADGLWMLGGLGSMLRSGEDAATVTFRYADGSSADAAIVAGKHLNGFQYFSEVSQGFCAWSGRTPSRKDAVLWCWNISNPKPDKEIVAVKIINKNKIPLGIIAMTREIIAR